MKACTGFRPILFITHDLSLGYYISERAVML
jgi:ABC-type dipeptide/oligopeptide/nickel transport system ATPase subunit